MMMTMLRSYLMCQQQVPQCVWPYQGPFLGGRLLLRLLSSRHAGEGGGGGSAHQPAMGGTEGCAARRNPFLPTPASLQPDQRAHTAHDGGHGLNEQRCHSAGQQSCEAPFNQQGLLATLTVRHRRALRASACLDKRCF